MSNKRLLKRIRQWSEDSSVNNDTPDHQQYILSILDDLNKIYNTRQGTVILDPSFGIPDFTSLMSTMSPPELELLTHAFVKATTQYEPRIQRLTVTYKPRDGDRGLVRFNAEGQTKYKNQSHPLIFDILLQGDGSVALQIT